MSCKRCEDIHLSQKDGKTQKKCECDCHDDNSTFTYHDLGGSTLTVPCAITGSTDLTWSFANNNDNGGAFMFNTVPNGTVINDVTSAQTVPPYTGVGDDIHPAYPCTCVNPHTHEGECDFCRENHVPKDGDLCTCGVNDACDWCHGNDINKPKLKKRGGERRFNT